MADEIGLTIKGLIGEGAFGEVYLVENGENEEFAMKVMKYASEEERDMATHEIEVLKELSHDHVIAYVGAFLQDGRLFILTEYCAGGDLTGFLEETKTAVPEDLLLVWLWQMACGLEYMHTREPIVLHRDMKPSNIYITQHGNIRLGDMGIARVLEHPSAMATTFCGTLPYMSPEALYEIPYNAKTDVWALGCCVVEMATLERAYSATTMLLLLRDVMIKEPRPLPRSKYSEALHGLVSRMLHKLAEERLSSTDLLQHDLMQNVYKKGQQPMDLLHKHKLLHGLASQRPPGTPFVDRQGETMHALTESVSNLKQILNDGKTMTSYRYKVEHRMRGRPGHEAVTRAMATVLASTQSHARKTEKKLGGSSTTSSSSSSSTLTPGDRSLRSIMSTVVEGLTSTLTPQQRTAQQGRQTGSDASRESLMTTLRTTLTRFVREDSLDSALVSVEESSTGEELMTRLQGLVRGDQLQTLASAIVFLALISRTSKRS